MDTQTEVGWADASNLPHGMHVALRLASLALHHSVCQPSAGSLLIVLTDSVKTVLPSYFVLLRDSMALANAAEMAFQAQSWIRGNPSLATNLQLVFEGYILKEVEQSIRMYELQQSLGLPDLSTNSVYNSWQLHDASNADSTFEEQDSNFSDTMNPMPEEQDTLDKQDSGSEKLDKQDFNTGTTNSTLEDHGASTLDSGVEEERTSKPEDSKEGNQYASFESEPQDVHDATQGEEQENTYFTESNNLQTWLPGPSEVGVIMALWVLLVPLFDFLTLLMAFTLVKLLCGYFFKARIAKPAHKVAGLDFGEFESKGTQEEEEDEEEEQEEEEE